MTLGAAELALEDLRAKYTNEQLRDAFVKRTLDNEFARIALLFYPRADYNHLAVWAGYEKVLGIDFKP